MKNILLSILCLLPLTAKAQWFCETREADELKGISKQKIYSYFQEGVGAFQFSELREDLYWLKAETGIFNVESSYGITGCSVLVGIYDNSGHLIDKFSMYLDKQSPDLIMTRNAGSLSIPVGQKKKVKKIMEHLKNEKGAIRIVAPMYNKPDFDIFIPCMNNE